MEVRRTASISIDFAYADYYLKEDYLQIVSIEEKDVGKFLHENIESPEPEWENPNYSNERMKIVRNGIDSETLIHMRHSERLCIGGFSITAKCGYTYNAVTRKEMEKVVRRIYHEVTCAECLNVYKKKLGKK